MYNLQKETVDENVNDETTQSAEEYFRINYLYIVDQAISSIESRFEQFQIYENIFGFLFNFEKLKLLDEDSLKKKIVLILNVFSHMKLILILMAQIYFQN